MAEQAPETPPQEGAEEAPPPKFLSMRMLLILAGVFLLEGLTITAVFLFFGGPADVNAEEEAAKQMAEGEKLVEVHVVTDRFPNTRSGRNYVYETEVYLQVRQKHKDEVRERVETAKARVTSEVAQIFRACDPVDLAETTLATLRRQIYSRLDDLFGEDEEGGALIQRVLIPKCTQYRTDL